MAKAGKGGKPKELPRDRTVATNRKARHDYDILDTWEAGIQLFGAEVKSIRDSKVTVRDAFARVEGREVWCFGIHVNPYPFARDNYDPDRRRKLLLHRDEIDEMARKVDEQGLTLIPLKLYLKNGLVKVELGLAKGRRSYDKRHALAERDSQREMARALRATERD
jgi:SsrA-binding protein